MLAYYLLFLAITLTAVIRMYPNYVVKRGFFEGVLGFFGIAIFVLFSGLRHEVGGDWVHYLDFVDMQRNADFPFYLLHEPLWLMLNWFAANVGGGIYFVNLICAFIFFLGLLKFCRILPRPELALTVSFPVLVIVIAMGFTRQSVGIAFVMMALVALQRDQFFRFISFIFLAATFHKTSLVILPFAMFYGFKNRFLLVVPLVLILLILSLQLFRSSIDYLIAGYLITEYDAKGAAVRLAMNVIPAMIFIVWRNSFHLTQKQKVFWKWISIFALTLVPLMMVSPSSVPVDRMGFYLIPLQLLVWSHFPDVMGRKGHRNSFWVGLVIVYTGVILVVWFTFSSHSFAWVPYKFYPFIWAFY